MQPRNVQFTVVLAAPTAARAITRIPSKRLSEQQADTLAAVMAGAGLESHDEVLPYLLDAIDAAKQPG